MTKKNLWRGAAFLFAVLILIGSTAGAALETNRNMVDSFLGTQSYTIVTDSTGDALYTTFTADYSDTAQLVAAHQMMGKQLTEEGSVLLKNNGVLPLNEQQRKVTILGLRADAKTIYGATVGVSVPSSQNVSLTQALTERGFQVNEEVNSAYEGVGKQNGYKKDVNKVNASFSGVYVSSKYWQATFYFCAGENFWCGSTVLRHCQG